MSKKHSILLYYYDIKSGEIITMCGKLLERPSTIIELGKLNHNQPPYYCKDKKIYRKLRGREVLIDDFTNLY